jgi:hypothetical protein
MQLYFFIRKLRAKLLKIFAGKKVNPDFCIRIFKKDYWSGALPPPRCRVTNPLTSFVLLTLRYLVFVLYRT